LTLKPRNVAWHSPGQPMMSGLRIALSIVALLQVVNPSPGADFTYQEYAKASDAWKRGFVFAISRYVSVVAQPDEEAPYPVRTAFQRCLANATDEHLARQVATHVARNPAAANGPMVTVVMRALFALCRAEIERSRLPEAAPGRR
jgi:hypothetical protein